MRAKEMERNAHLLQQHVHWRQPGGFANRVFDRDDDGNPVEVVRDSLTCMWVPCPAQWSEQAKAEGIADVVSDRRRPALGRMARMQNENDQFMRHAVQPRLVLVTEALRALRPLTTTNTGVGPIEAAVQRLVDRSAAVVIALNHHPDRITRIGAWEDIVHARGLQTTGPLGEASATPIFRLPLALLQKIGESLKKLQLLDGTAGEVLGAFKKIETLTARLLSEVNEDNFGAAVSSNFVSLQSPWARYLKSSSPSGEMAAAREVLDEIEGIVDYATSLMSWPLGFTTMDLRLQS
jgi:hypothetical protein